MAAPAAAVWSALAAATPAPAAAAEVSAPTESLRLQAHGFVSQGFIKSTANNYLASSERGSFEFTEVGLNFTAQLMDKLRTGIQLFGRDLGPVNNYTARLDWFYLDYRFADWLGLRAGRVKIPFGLYNEIIDVDMARVPILLPQSIYPLSSRDFLLAQTGMELYGYVPLGAGGGGGALDYRLYGGTIFLQIQNMVGSPRPVQRLEVPYVVGGRLLWETPLDGLRVGGTAQAIRLESRALDVASGVTPFTNFTVLLWVASLEYAARDLLLAAEAGSWHYRMTTDDPLLPPAMRTMDVDSGQGYVMGAYRVAPWLHPGVYYSLLFPNLETRSGRENMQHDVAATLRFDINPFWLVKVEGHFMHGTAGLDPVLNGDTARGLLSANWGVFLVKTTAYF